MKHFIHPLDKLYIKIRITAGNCIENFLGHSACLNKLNEIIDKISLIKINNYVDANYLGYVIIHMESEENWHIILEYDLYSNGKNNYKPEIYYL